MRWIEVILNDEGARANFIEYLAQMEGVIHKKIIEAVKAQDFPRATGLSYELNVYQTLKQAFDVNADNIRSKMKGK